MHVESLAPNRQRFDGDHDNPWLAYERQKQAIAETATSPREYETRLAWLVREVGV